jgi:hypothetical protein
MRMLEAQPQRVGLAAEVRDLLRCLLSRLSLLAVASELPADQAQRLSYSPPGAVLLTSLASQSKKRVAAPSGGDLVEALLGEGGMLGWRAWGLVWRLDGLEAEAGELALLEAVTDCLLVIVQRRAGHDPARALEALAPTAVLLPLLAGSAWQVEPRRWCQQGRRRKGKGRANEEEEAWGSGDEDNGADEAGDEDEEDEAELDVFRERADPGARAIKAGWAALGAAVVVKAFVRRAFEALGARDVPPVELMEHLAKYVDLMSRAEAVGRRLELMGRRGDGSKAAGRAQKRGRGVIGPYAVGSGDIDDTEGSSGKGLLRQALVGEVGVIPDHVRDAALRFARDQFCGLPFQQWEDGDSSTLPDLSLRPVAAGAAWGVGATVMLLGEVMRRGEAGRVPSIEHLRDIAPQLPVLNALLTFVRKQRPRPSGDAKGELQHDRKVCWRLTISRVHHRRASSSGSPSDLGASFAVLRRYLLVLAARTRERRQEGS